MLSGSHLHQMYLQFNLTLYTLMVALSSGGHSIALQHTIALWLEDLNQIK